MHLLTHADPTGRDKEADMMKLWPRAGIALALLLFAFTIYRLITVPSSPEWQAWSIGCVAFGVIMLVVAALRRRH
jgi:hypothetical protein